MMPKLRPLYHALTLTIVCGCSSNHKSIDVAVDPALVKLSAAAEEISSSYKILSYAESEARKPGELPKSYSLRDFPAEWAETYALADDFFGELEPFLRGLSKLTGYDEPQIIGVRPTVPVVISIPRATKSLADFLVDASYQAGDRAEVVLDHQKQRLTIIYGKH